MGWKKDNTAIFLPSGASSINQQAALHSPAAFGENKSCSKITDHPLQCFPVRDRAAAIPCCDAVGEDPLNGKVVEENYNPLDQGRSVQDPQEVLDMTPRNLSWQTLTSVPAVMDRQWWCFIRGSGGLIVVTVVCRAIWRPLFLKHLSGLPLLTVHLCLSCLSLWLCLAVSMLLFRLAPDEM